MGIDIVRTTIERDLGASLALSFAPFDETPLAAATIAQVHRATLHDGRKIALKPRRPDLQALIAKDIAALTTLGAWGERLVPSLRALDLPVVVKEFSRSLSREIDFGHEARSIALFRTALMDFSDPWIPGVIPALSKGAVLTLEFSPGERIDHYAGSHPGTMPRAINTLVRLMLQSIILDERMRESLMLLLEAVVKDDARAASEPNLDLARALRTYLSSLRGLPLLGGKPCPFELHRADVAQRRMSRWWL